MSDYLFAPDRFATDRFVLRSYFPGDGPLLAEATNSSYEHLRVFMDWAQPHQSDRAAEQLVRTFRGRYLLAEDFVLGIFTLDEAQLLGGTGYHLREGPLSGGNAEVGMWIRASAAGRGLGTAVLRALVEWGFSEWPWQRLAWRCSHRNVASQRTAEKAGLQHEGVLRRRLRRADGSHDDEVCYGILKSEWRDGDGRHV